jgi:hypothetical protein
MLVKRCIFSFSRKKLPFFDVTAYLQSYYYYEKKIFSFEVFLKRWPKYKCLSE